MEKKIVTKTFMSTTSIQKEREVNVFIANDGKEFDNEQQCLNYENMLELTKQYGHYFKNVDLEEEEILSILKLSFGGYGYISSELMFVYKHTEESLEYKIQYLKSVGFNNVYMDNFKKLTVGTTYVIASWCEGWYSDYPSYYGEIRELQKVLDSLDKISNCFKSFVS